MKLDYKKLLEAKKYIDDYDKARKKLQQQRIKIRRGGLFIFDDVVFLSQCDMTHLEHTKKMIILLNNDKCRIEYNLRKGTYFSNWRLKEKLGNRQIMIMRYRKQLIELLKTGNCHG